MGANGDGRNWVGRGRKELEVVPPLLGESYAPVLCCALLRESNSMYFDGGVHTDAALRWQNASCVLLAQRNSAQRMCERPVRCDA